MSVATLLPAGTGFNPANEGGYGTGEYLLAPSPGAGTFPTNIQDDDGDTSWEKLSRKMPQDVPVALTAAVDAFDATGKTIVSVTTKVIAERVGTGQLNIGVCRQTGSGTGTTVYRYVGSPQTVDTASYQTYASTTYTACPWTSAAWTQSDIDGMQPWLDSDCAAPVVDNYIKATKVWVEIDYTVDSLPTDPSGLSATTISQTQINLAWTDNSSNETGFYLDRALDSGFSSGLMTATLSANATTSSATSLSAATTYYFRVRAFNAYGSSSNTSTVSATTLPTAPTAPSGLSSTAISSVQINLAWTDNSSNEDGFYLDRALDSGFSTELTSATMAADVTTASWAGLTANTTYYFRVRAYNTGGSSSNTSTVSATTLDSALASPSELTATTVSFSQIDLSWADNSGNETGFYLEQATDSGFTSGLVVHTLGANVTTYSSVGLLQSTTYYFRVSAYNTAGNSSPSSVASATTLTILPIAPSELSATAVSQTQVNLSWHDNSNNETGFYLDRATNSGFSSGLTTVAIAANATTASSTGLSANTPYYFRIRSYNSAGSSANTTAASAVTFSTPSTPGIFSKVELLGGNNISLNTSGQNLTISCEPGAGTGTFSNCDDSLVLRSLSGQTADAHGSLCIESSECYWAECQPNAYLLLSAPVTVQQADIHTLSLHGDCVACRQCQDYVNVYKQLRTAYEHAAAVQSRLIGAISAYEVARATVQQVASWEKSTQIILNIQQTPEQGFAPIVAIRAGETTITAIQAHMEITNGSGGDLRGSVVYQEHSGEIRLPRNKETDGDSVFIASRGLWWSATTPGLTEYMVAWHRFGFRIVGYSGTVNFKWTVTASTAAGSITQVCEQSYTI